MFSTRSSACLRSGIPCQVNHDLTLRTFFTCKTQSKPPSSNPSENPPQNLFRTLIRMAFVVMRPPRRATKTRAMNSRRLWLSKILLLEGLSGKFRRSWQILSWFSSSAKCSLSLSLFFSLSLSLYLPRFGHFVARKTDAGCSWISSSETATNFLIFLLPRAHAKGVVLLKRRVSAFQAFSKEPS